MPCTVYLEGEYGINNLFIGVPVKLGTKGVEEIIKMRLTEEEKKALHASAAAVQRLVDDMKRFG
jgi:malate dehydrogenase